MIKSRRKAAFVFKGYLWVADPRQVTFSCLSKRKSPKRRTPRMAQRLPRLRGFGSRRCPNEASCLVGPSRTSLCATPSGRSPKALRCSGAPYGVKKIRCHLLVFSNPRSARRVPQPHREYSSEPVFEPEARILRPASWRAPGGARVRRSSHGSPVDFHAAERVRRDSAHSGYEGEVARSGACYLLVPFLCTSKEKEPAVGQPPTSSF
jgi:hypothetical protein